MMETKFLFSAALIASMLLLRWLILHSLQRVPVDDTATPRRWKNAINNISSLLTLSGLLLIWLSELRFVALSIATFAVALVIAAREFIQCFLGAIYLASSRPFTVGDWISINHQCGEVASSDWLNTILLEVDMAQGSYAYTGRTLIIPNNQFVSGSIKNLNYMRRYIAHSFTLVRDAEQINLFELREPLLEKAQAYCAPFHEIGQRYSNLIKKRLGINMPDNPISVDINTTELGKNQLTVSYFCPTEKAAEIEQQLIRDFMAYWYALLEQKQQPKDKKHD